MCYFNGSRFCIPSDQSLSTLLNLENQEILNEISWGFATTHKKLACIDTSELQSRCKRFLLIQSMLAFGKKILQLRTTEVYAGASGSISSLKSSAASSNAGNRCSVQNVSFLL